MKCLTKFEPFSMCNFPGKLLWIFQIFRPPFASDILSFQILRFGKRFSAHPILANGRGGFWQILAILQTYKLYYYGEFITHQIKNLPFPASSGLISFFSNYKSASVKYTGSQSLMILWVLFFLFYHCLIWKWTSSHWRYAKWMFWKVGIVKSCLEDL